MCVVLTFIQNCFMRKPILFLFSAIATLSSLAQGNIPSKTETRVIIRDGGLNDGQKPLVVIDGKPGGDLQSIPPDKIVRMDVIKGNSATEIYGSEGKNGVIIITTKGAIAVDTLPAGTKKVERIVTVNKFKMNDASRDTTIIRMDSMMVMVDGETINVNGNPMGGNGERIVKGFAIPRMGGQELDRDVFLFDGDRKMAWERKESPKIGLSVQDAEEGKGVLVTAVVPTGAASKAGIQVNDRLVSVDQVNTDDVDALKSVIWETHSKRSVMVKLLRGKKEINVELVYPKELKKADL